MPKHWSLDELGALAPAMGEADVSNPNVDEALAEAYMEQEEAELRGRPTISFLNLPQETRRAIMILADAMPVDGDSASTDFLLGFDMGMTLATLFKRLGREWPFL